MDAMAAGLLGAVTTPTAYPCGLILTPLTECAGASSAAKTCPAMRRKDKEPCLWE